MTRVLVQCDGAPLPAGWCDESWDIRLELRRSGPRENVCFAMDDLATVLGAAVPDAALDLARIAAYAYIADQLVSRGGAADIYGTDWKRTFAVCLPVTQPDLWRSAPVLAALSDVLSFASGDSWRFAFTGGAPSSRPALSIDPRRVRIDPDAVYLFSGGADSLCAAVAAAAAGEHPFLLSHQPEGRVEGRQQVLVDELQHRFGLESVSHAGVQLHKRHARERDTSQRTRGFLFASLGAAAALTLELPRVVLADNGVVSLNLPVNDQLIGTLASRSTHPQFLHLFNRLLALAVANAPHVENPLQFRTRAETLTVLKETKLRHLLGLTRSCASGRRLPTDAPQCGVCSQCIDRRFAALIAGLTDADPASGYTTDILLDPLHERDRTMALSYVRFAQQNKDRDAETLHLEYPQLDAALSPADPQPVQTMRALCGLVQRHCQTVSTAAEAQVYAAQAGHLPRTPHPQSLLGALVAARGVPLRLRQVETVALTAEEEAFADKQGFTVRDTPIVLTGRMSKRASNIVRIGGHEVDVPDTEFQLLLRLVVALLTTDDGYIRLGTEKHDGGLRSEAIASGQTIHRWASDLRTLIKPAFVGLDGLDIVQISRSRIRLSAHPRLVTADKQALLRHQNALIRELARLLPDSPERGGPT